MNGCRNCSSCLDGILSATWNSRVWRACLCWARVWMEGRRRKQCWKTGQGKAQGVRVNIQTSGGYSAHVLEGQVFGPPLMMSQHMLTPQQHEEQHGASNRREHQIMAGWLAWKLCTTRQGHPSRDMLEWSHWWHRGRCSGWVRKDKHGLR